MAMRQVDEIVPLTSRREAPPNPLMRLRSVHFGGHDGQAVNKDAVITRSQRRTKTVQFGTPEAEAPLITRSQRRTKTVQFGTPAAEVTKHSAICATADAVPQRSSARRERSLPATVDRAGQVSGRKSFEVLPGQHMEYQLFLPESYDPSVPIPFLVSVSGTGQSHVNGFSHRLPSSTWAVAVPLRPETAPLMFLGTGAQGDGVWYLQQFCQHVLQNFNVEGGRLLMVGVSNGGTSVLRCATLWPELCRGLIVVTGALKGLAHETELKRLQGLPIDMYVGTKDEAGFYQPMVELEGQLRAIGHSPQAQLTIFEGAGHVCSTLVDSNVLLGKIRLMLLRSRRVGETAILSVATAPRDTLCTLSSSEVLKTLSAFADRLGFGCVAGGGNHLQVTRLSDAHGNSPSETALTSIPAMRRWKSVHLGEAARAESPEAPQGRAAAVSHMKPRVLTRAKSHHVGDACRSAYFAPP